MQNLPPLLLIHPFHLLIISRKRKSKLLSGTLFHDIMISTGLLAYSNLPPPNQSKGGDKTECIFIIIPLLPFPFCLFYYPFCLFSLNSL